VFFVLQFAPGSEALPFSFSSSCEKVIRGDLDKQSLIDLKMLETSSKVEH